MVADFKSGSRQGHERMDDRDDDPDDRTSSPDDLADRLNLQQQLERAFARLPQDACEGADRPQAPRSSYEEVAAELGLSIHTVEKYITRRQGLDQNHDLGTLGLSTSHPDRFHWRAPRIALHPGSPRWKQRGRPVRSASCATTRPA